MPFGGLWILFYLCEGGSKVEERLHQCVGADWSKVGLVINRR
jgi:hypothetical protein